MGNVYSLPTLSGQAVLYQSGRQNLQLAYLKRVFVGKLWYTSEVGKVYNLPSEVGKVYYLPNQTSYTMLVR